MSTDVTTRSAAEAALLSAQQDSEFDSGMYQTPILKIGQPLTKEVSAEQAEAGEFINSMLGEGIGDKIGFIVAFRHQGRFASDPKSGRGYSAHANETLIPERWEPLVGPEFVGTPFDEHPDAEEVFKADVNAKRREWGSGPLISTTYNFTGLAIVPSSVEDEEDEIQPVRLSLKRTDVQAARKWATLIKSIRGPQWSKVFDLSTQRNPYDRGSAYNLVVRLGRDATADEQQQAVELGTAAMSGRVTDNQEGESATDKSVEPDAKGGLAV